MRYAFVLLGFVLGLTAILFFTPQENTAPPDFPLEDNPHCKRCNVLLITFDALRADHLGLYGYSKETSPNLDEFSRDSYVFTDSISQSGTTVYSVSSLLTSGLWSPDNLLINYSYLRNEPTTIAEVLSNTGYDTLGVVGHYTVKGKYGFSQGFRILEDDYPVYGRADITVQQALKILRENKTKPFFMWIHIREPHSPYIPPKRLLRIFNDMTLTESSAYDEIGLYYDTSPDEKWIHNHDVSGAALKKYRSILMNESMSENKSEVRIWGLLNNLSDKDIDWFTGAYDANIRFADEQFGDIMNYLSSSALVDDTVVVVSADHGESLGGHGLFDHNAVYYDILHTPLIVRVPGYNGGVKKYPVSNLDVFPTIMDLVGVNYSGRMRGMNLFDDRRDDYIQYADIQSRSTVIKDGWKLIVAYNLKNDELYYLPDDPGETRNLAEEQTEKHAHLRNISLSIRKGMNPAGKGRVEPNPEVKEILKDLGYLT